jgi:hypothetical protein
MRERVLREMKIAESETGAGDDRGEGENERLESADFRRSGRLAGSG